MADPFCLLLDEDGDIDMSRGIRFTPDLSTYVVQRLAENLSFFLGDWFLDLRQGVPYFTKVYGETPDFALLRTLFSRAILETVGVGSITALDLSFEGNTRQLSVAFVCVLTDGSTITQTDLAKLFLPSF